MSLAERVLHAAASVVVGEPKAAALEQSFLPEAKLATVTATAGALPGVAPEVPPSRAEDALSSSVTAPVRVDNRLTGSVWMLARGDNVAAVATNGVLGGSEAGARLLYRIKGTAVQPLSLSARLSGPLRSRGAEAALGVEWQPVAGAPVRMLAERRQRVGGDGRSAFALLAHGGVSNRPIGGGMMLDAYAQVGVVGVRSRDLFADGGLTLVRPLGLSRIEGAAAGAGAWAGVQSGASRLDVGPRLTTTLGTASLQARVSLDWRFRVAGSAAPSSGPSLTIGTDF